MPHTQLAGNAVTGLRDQAEPPDTRAPAPVTPGHSSRKTVLPGTARSDKTGSARAETRGDRLWRVVGLLRRVPKTGACYYDPLFERPDLIEDDYYRLRNQPHG